MLRQPLTILNHTEIFFFSTALNKSINTMFKQIFIGLASLLLCYVTVAQQNETMEAGMGKVKVSFSIDQNGNPVYQVSFDNKPVVLPSHLGFVLSNDSTFYKDFELTGSEKNSFDETWQPVWGEVKDIRNHYEQLTVHLKQKKSGLLLNIIFRAFEDGIGFRYEFPKQEGLKYFI